MENRLFTPEAIAVKRSRMHQEGAASAHTEEGRARHIAAMRRYDKAALEIALGNRPTKVGDVWYVRSRTSDALYRVSPKDWSCNCPAGLHGKPCWHVAAVQVMQEAEELGLL